MKDICLFYENFYSFAAALADAPGGALSRFSNGSFAVSSGEPYAGENYAVFGRDATETDVFAAKKFFDEAAADFIVPLRPDAAGELTSALTRLGLSKKRLYTAMSLDADKFGDKANPARAVGKKDALKWGAAVWRAFGGSVCAAAVSYAAFCAYLATRETDAAFAYEAGGEYVSTALIHETPGTLGLYYFATRPDFRRRGLAKRLLDGVCAALSYKGKPLVLLATEEGLPFYLNYGFDVTGKIPIYSATDDI